MVVQPTFLYELLWNLVIFAVLIYLDRRFSIGHGRLFALYVAGYCIGRFGIELLRDDTATHIAGIRINLFTSTFVFIGAVVYLILAPKGREDPATLSASAADRLVPDEVDEAITVSSDSAATEPVGEPAVEAAAVAAEADAAEVDAPEAALAETETPDEPAEEEPEKAEEEPSAEAETEKAEADGDEAETESADDVEVEEAAESADEVEETAELADYKVPTSQEPTVGAGRFDLDSVTRRLRGLSSRLRRR
jgi:hypothetical protein